MRNKKNLYIISIRWNTFYACENRRLFCETFVMNNTKKKEKKDKSTDSRGAQLYLKRMVVAPFQFPRQGYNPRYRYDSTRHFTWVIR